MPIFACRFAVRRFAFPALCALWLLAAASPALGQSAPPPERRLLWPEGAPGALGAEPADQPAVTLYFPAPEAATGAAVVVCPGGGYGHLALDHEGRQIAEWLVNRGVAAAVLEYRLGPRYGHPAPLLDAQRALRLVRSLAASHHLRPDRIGVWGFSAGGHLAATASTQFDAGEAGAADPIDRQSARPDFSILAYPVITMGEYTHRGSRGNLLGAAPDSALVARMSAERRITAETPPAFLFHTTDDGVVPVENSLLYFAGLRAHGIPAEMHVFERGRHGVGLAPLDPALDAWSDLLDRWLRSRGLLSR